MEAGISRLYEVNPDPFDESQREYIRICLFKDVKNAVELKMLLQSGSIQAAFIRAEMVLEPFILLAAANRACHQAAHNRMATRSLPAELIYSLSPTRNISESFKILGIGENSKDLIVVIFDDISGHKMTELAGKIDGQPVPLDQLRFCSDRELIKKVYMHDAHHISEHDGESLSDAIVTRILAKDQ